MRLIELGSTHHPSDAYRFVVHPALETDAGTNEASRYKPHQNIEDLDHHVRLR